MNEGKPYRTIVADPPWSYAEGWPTVSTSAKRRPGYTPPPNADYSRRKPLSYPMMSLDEIGSLPIPELCAKDAHLYLWTTNRYLRDAFAVCEGWGFRYSQLLVWAKKPMGIGVGGAFQTNAEYVLFARRGSLKALRRIDTCWFNWPRMGNNHSRKPEAFLDLVEQVSPGPYLEMFARRARFGWDYYGDESFETASMAEAQ